MSTTRDFVGKTVLVVGGAGYLASPVCELLAERGANVVLTDLNENRAANLAVQLSDRFEVQTAGYALDMGDTGAVEHMVERTVERTGRLDVLINASFASTFQSLEELSVEELERCNRVQITGAFVLSRAAAKAMQTTAGQGAMVHFSSMYGSISPVPAMYDPPTIPVNPIEYGLGKAALEQMIRYLASHYGPANIRVNGVAPGSFPHKIAPGYEKPEFREFEKRLAAKCPLGRIGRQDELAGPVVFLASEAASYITGQVLAVDGGVKVW